MSGWISVKERYPEKGDKVWYFFEHTGVSQGEFFGFEPCYSGFVDADGNDVSHPKCKLPDCELHKGCTGYDYFGSESGYLGGDVTHWIPDTGQDRPERPDGFLKGERYVPENEVTEPST